MTPTSPVTPLSREEEAKFRESVAYLASDAFQQDELPLQWSNYAAQRLLATLDASRAVTETPEGLDVERLALAMDRAGIATGIVTSLASERRDIFRRMATRTTAEYARLTAHKEEHGG